MFIWLERGVQERGGEAPSQRLSLEIARRLRGVKPLLSLFPLSNKRCREKEKINLFERWIKGVSLENHPLVNKT
jgi:hypothetical protein